MSEAPRAKKLPSPQERLDLILLGIARLEPATALCAKAGVSRELFYRWMRAVRQASLKAVEAKLPGPKRIEPEKAPKEALRLRARVERLEKEARRLRWERDHQRLLAGIATRIIERNAWNQPAGPKLKKNGMRSQKCGNFTWASGGKSAMREPAPRILPGAGESAGARTGDGLVEGGAR
jgi:transposase-like protein